MLAATETLDPLLAHDWIADEFQESVIMKSGISNLHTLEESAQQREREFGN